MHCVYLALWPRKVLCGRFYASYINVSFISFIHIQLYVNLNIGSVKLHTLVYDILPWRKVPESDNAGSVRVGVHLCGPHDSVSGTEGAMPEV